MPEVELNPRLQPALLLIGMKTNLFPVKQRDGTNSNPFDIGSCHTVVISPGGC
jgi:hypothetical protein